MCRRGSLIGRFRVGGTSHNLTLGIAILPI